MITELNTCLIKWLEEQTEKSGIIQQLNCFHTQGGGIALRIKNKYPSMYVVDIQFGRKGDITKLGKFCVTEVSLDKFCYGYYGQYNYGMEKRHTNYEAVYNGLKSIEQHAFENGLKLLGLPKNMGCCLGGGSWVIVRAIIYDIFEESPMKLYVCNYEG